MDINRYVAGNGTVSFATKRNSNARNVPTANFNLWDTMTFTITSEGKDPNGRDVVGVYAIFPDNTCRFLCCDFDDKSCEHGYEKDVIAYVCVCRDWGIPAYIERSRSGNGAHVWILFDGPIKSKDGAVSWQCHSDGGDGETVGCHSNHTTDSSRIRISCLPGA